MKNCKSYIRTDGIEFKYAKGESERNGKEIHPFHEIVFFMGKKAFLFSETVKTEVLPNTVIVIPKDCYHQLNIIGEPDDYTRCTLNFYNIPELNDFIETAMKKLLVTEASPEIIFLFEKLIYACTSPSDSDAILLKAVLTVILSEIKKHTFISKGVYSSNDNIFSLKPVVQRCISYISENIGNSLSITDIAKYLNISKSSLSHIFKSEMNTSLHRYILNKRLSIANDKISRGIPVTTVAAECGFKEYSGFYRQYKQMFGVPPSASR